MSEVPHMPTKPEILALAIKMFQEDMIRKGIEPITPTERELKEGNWFEKARLDLMTGVKSQLEEYLTYLDTEAASIRDQLGITPEPPPREVRELVEQIDIVSVRLRETRGKLREAKDTIERLRAVKVPPKIVAPPPVRYLTAEEVERLWQEFIRYAKFRYPELIPDPKIYRSRFDETIKPAKTFEEASAKITRLIDRIVKELKPVRVPVRRPVVLVEPAELERDFPDYLRECGITMQEYRRLDHTGKTVMRNEYRRWKLQPY